MLSITKFNKQLKKYFCKFKIHLTFSLNTWSSNSYGGCTSTNEFGSRVNISGNSAGLESSDGIHLISLTYHIKIMKYKNIISLKFNKKIIYQASIGNNGIRCLLVLLQLSTWFAWNNAANWSDQRSSGVGEDL